MLSAAYYKGVTTANRNAENVKMLEQKIEDLTKAVETMTDVMISLSGNIERLSSNPPDDTLHGDDQTNGAGAGSTATPVEQDVEQGEPVPNSKEAPTVAREDVQDMCMNIVREDRSKQASIKSAIAAYDGAKTLKDVAEQNLAALKADLEKI